MCVFETYAGKFMGTHFKGGGGHVDLFRVFKSYSGGHIDALYSHKSPKRLCKLMILHCITHRYTCGVTVTFIQLE